MSDAEVEEGRLGLVAVTEKVEGLQWMGAGPLSTLVSRANSRKKSKVATLPIIVAPTGGLRGRV